MVDQTDFFVFGGDTGSAYLGSEESAPVLACPRGAPVSLPWPIAPTRGARRSVS